MQQPTYKGWELVKDRQVEPHRWFCWSPKSKDGTRRKVFIGNPKAIDAFVAMKTYVDMRGGSDG